MASSKKNPSLPLPGLTVPVSAASMEPPATATMNLAPTAAAKLGADADKPVPGTQAGNALPGWQSLGKDHKPTHSFGKQGRREKKVRW